MKLFAEGDVMKSRRVLVYRGFAASMLVEWAFGVPELHSVDHGDLVTDLAYAKTNDRNSEAALFPPKD